MKMLKCSPLGQQSSVDNVSEFEVIVKAATDKIYFLKKIKWSDRIHRNQHYHKNSKRVQV